jgi:outer membrane protein
MRNVIRLLVLAAFLMPQLSLAETKIGYIDLQRALNEVSEGKSAKKKLERLVKKKKKDIEDTEKSLEQTQKDLQDEKTKLEQQLPLMKEDARKEKMDAYLEKAEKFRNDYLEYQKVAMETQQELQQKELEFMEPIIKKIRIVAKQFCKDKGYAYILDKAAVVYGPEGDEVTDELILEYDKTK